MNEQLASNDDRAHWMSILARSRRADVAQHWGTFEAARFSWLKKPEFGTALVQGRTNGNESPFNFGEITMTRCSIQLDDGRIGVAYVAGCDKQHAMMAAVFDAWLQRDDAFGRRARSAIDDLSARIEARRQGDIRKARASQVDFTMHVRD
jgi:alpha-D-ribose 1-methylphosphonate 5-triphosphate synthase subunit PhnG